MVAPVITPASIVTLNGGTNPNGTMAIPISAAGNGRLVLIGCKVKDNSATAADVSSITFDATGVNRTIGSGVTLQGSRQLAQESTFSSQSIVYFVLDSDLPSLAGTYTIDVIEDSATQHNMWTALEVTGCFKQEYDNLVQNIDLTDVSAGVSFAAAITPNDPDCLIIDLWATSHSASPTFTTSQTLVSTVSNTNGAFVCSQFTQVGAATLKVMTETSSTLHQRRAYSVFSFSGVAPGGPTGIPVLRRRIEARKAA